MDLQMRAQQHWGPTFRVHYGSSVRYATALHSDNCKQVLIYLHMADFMDNSPVSLRHQEH